MLQVPSACTVAVPNSVPLSYRLTVAPRCRSTTVPLRVWSVTLVTPPALAMVTTGATLSSVSETVLLVPVKPSVSVCLTTKVWVTFSPTSVTTADQLLPERVGLASGVLEPST